MIYSIYSIDDRYSNYGITQEENKRTFHETRYLRSDLLTNPYFHELQFFVSFWLVQLKSF